MMFTCDIIPGSTGRHTNILAKTGNDRYMIFDIERIKNRWKWAVAKYNLVWWAWCEDIEYMLEYKRNCQ